MTTRRDFGRGSRGLRGAAFGVLAVLAAACGGDAGSGSDAASELEPVTFDDLQNAALSLATFEGDTVQLSSGSWQSPVGRERVELLPEYTGAADVDGDGMVEQVGLMRLFHPRLGEVYGLYSIGPSAAGPEMEADQPIAILFDLNTFEVVDGRIRLLVDRTGVRGVRRREELTYAILNGAWTLESQRTMRGSTES